MSIYKVKLYIIIPTVIFIVIGFALYGINQKTNKLESFYKNSGLFVADRMACIPNKNEYNDTHADDQVYFIGCGGFF